MATFQIWEFYSSGNTHEQVAMLSANAPQNITAFVGAHQEGSAFDNATIGIQIQTDTDCWFKLYKSGAASPLGDVATSSNGIRLTAAQGMVYYGTHMAAGHTLSVFG